MIYSEVCKNIRELRINKGMTQLELGRKLGISKSVISSYENEIHLPPYDILIKLSKIFGVTTDYLLGLEPRHTVSVEGLTEIQIQSVENIISELQEINEKLVIKGAK